jgi:hypothetical protein
MADLRNIALTVEATSAAEEIMKRLSIEERMDMIRIALAYAIKHEVDPSRAGSLGTRGGWNYDTGGLDSDGLMAEIVKLYHPDADTAVEPYRAVEALMNRGMELLRDHWNEGLIGSVSDLVAADS